MHLEGVLTHGRAGSSESCSPHASYMTIPRTFKSVITGSYMHRKVLTSVRRSIGPFFVPCAIPVICRRAYGLAPLARSRETHLHGSNEEVEDHPGLIVSRRLSGPCNGTAPFAVALDLASEVLSG